MRYSLNDITRIIDSTAVDVEGEIEHLLLDSRKVYTPATSLFFALKGPRRDGHQFIPELYKKAIRNFVVSEPIDKNLYPKANFLQVKDTLKALQQLAAHHRKQFHIPVIGITGSNGKTIVKEWLYQLLHEDYNIVRSPKSYNSQIGVPLSVWQMNEHNTLAIFEAGISTTGEMENLEKVIQPTIGVLTNIGDAHNEGFKNKKEKFKEKIRLFRNVEYVVCNSADDPKDKLVENTKGKIYTWGISADNEIQVVAIEKKQEFTAISLTGEPYGQRISQHFNFSIPFTDNASVENAILCFTICYKLGLDMSKIATRMKQLYPVEMRMQLKKAINNCYIINDSYSNDISSLGIALDYLKQQAGRSTATVILSDILQSGLDDKSLYKQIAAELKQRDVRRLIGIGEQVSGHFTYLQDAVAESSFYTSTEDFLDHVTSHQFRDEFILLKGARKFAFERISKWLEQRVHQTVLEINLNSVVHNLKQYQQVLQPATKLMAMVKAFAYGSGGAEIASVLQYHKVDYLGVAYADEGVELRKAGITLPVMVMNPEETTFDSIVDNNLEPEIYSFEILHAFHDFLEQQGIEHYPVHIEIETGMNRLGFDTKDMNRLGDFLSGASTINVQSVFSHLAASEEPGNDSFTGEQSMRFKNAADELQQKTGYSFKRHIANSAAILRHPQLQMDMVRLGIGLYGIDSSGSNQLDLQPAATLKSTVAQLKHLKAGESVSYNRKGLLARDSVIATVRLGYADGYPRRLGNGAGKMYIKGQLAPVVGTVCMDMTMIDVTDIPDVKEGDDVIIFGKELSIQQLSEWAGTIPYEIMTGISQRVKRVYFEE